MIAALIDNGSLESAAHRNLRAIAAQLALAQGLPVHAVSWKHSDRIPAAELENTPAWTLNTFVRTWWERGERHFVFVPFFISAQGAIGSALRRDLEKLQREFADLEFTLTDGLAARGVIVAIVAERVRELLATDFSGTNAPPPLIVVDHGGPSAVSASLRDALAGEIGRLLGPVVEICEAASMEGAHQPLLADLLSTAPFTGRATIVAPLFLSPGRHAGPGGDIAQICAAAASPCHLTALIGQHPLAIQTLSDVLQTTLKKIHSPSARMHSTPASSLTSTPEKALHKNEHLKLESNFLRGNILRDLSDHSTGSITEESGQLTKFHGIYAQDDRDLRNQRRKANQEKAFSFMARVRVPGGVCTPGQWLALDSLADQHANGTLKLTTRQAFQFHGILKADLWRTINGINRSLLDTIAACGDVNRNVMCNPNPEQSELHEEVYQVTQAISEHLLPRSHAYHELWVGDEIVSGGEPEVEPIYGKTYLPRKFKIVVAVPPSNDVDIYAHDLGYIAITDSTGKLVGFNVTVGGGLGMSHNQIETFPRIADVMGFCTVAQAVSVAEQVLTVQRDFGDRTDRKHARLKYTIADRGIDWFRGEVEARLGFRLEDPRPFLFTHTGDRYGWTQNHDRRWNFTLFIQSGRVKDTADYRLKSALREIALAHKGDLRLTANQNLVIANIQIADRPRIEAILRKHNLDTANHASGLKLNAMSCVALPTCGLALAESERYLPELVELLEAEFEAAGLRHDEVVLRVTGCPNGCGRPFLAEIGFVGKSPGKYNIYLGAAFNGSRLNTLYKANVPTTEIVPLLGPIIRRYGTERTLGERFGDFVIRTGYVQPTFTPQDFHESKAVKSEAG